MKPFVNLPVDAGKYPGSAENFEKGSKALQNSDSLLAYQFLKTANQIYAGGALCNYYLGRLAFGQGKFAEAKTYLSKARDLDGLRFRAPEQFNTILDSICARYPAAHLVDSKATFGTFSKGNIIGNELILEHVHPDLKGYAIMSDAFYQALKKERILPKNKDNKLTLNQLFTKMPVNPIDSLSGMYKVARLKNSWPFAASMRSDSFPVSTFEERTAYDVANRKIAWTDAMERLYSYYMDQHELAKARNIVESLILEEPSNDQLYTKSAMLSGELQDEPAALFNFTKAFQLSPTFETARYLFVLHLKQDQPEKAMPYLDYAISSNTSKFDLTSLKNATLQVIALRKGLAEDPTNVIILNQIAETYSKMDNKIVAARYTNQALKISRGAF